MSAIDEVTGSIERPEVKKFREVRKGHTHFAEGDVLFAKITPSMENGKAAIARNLINGIGCGTTELHVLRPFDGISPEFVFHYIRQEAFRSAAKARMTGTAGQLRVPSSYMENTTIPLAPSAEQLRIVSRMKEILDRSQAAKSALEKIPPLTKQFRRSLLTKAFRGELAKPDRNDEPSDKLLDRIRQVDRMKYPDEKSEPLDREDFGELPKGWRWINLGALLLNARYGTSQKCFPQRGGVPVIRIPNIVGGFLDFSDLKYTQLAEDEIRRLSVHEGDILVCRSNGSLDLVGRSALVQRLDGPFAFASYLIRLRPAVMEGLPQYLNLFFQTKLARNFIESRARSTAGQFNVNLEILRSIPTPLAPLQEQIRIVNRVQELFSRISQVEQYVKIGMADIPTLDQSLLARAFRGELSSQDSNDEPASLLLERIRANRAVRKNGKPQAILEIASSLRNVPNA